MTRDHVFPQSVFIDLDLQMITVQACDSCQRLKGLGDKDLRNLITLDLQTSHMPEADTLRKNWVKSMSVRERIWLERMLARAQEIDITDENGIVVSQAIEGDFEQSRIIGSHRMAVRALYSIEYEKPLPCNFPTHVQRIPWSIAGSLVSSLSKKVHFAIKQRGIDVVWWAQFQVEDEDEFSTVWFICYYDQILLLGATGNAALHLESQEETRRVLEEARMGIGLILPRRLVAPRNVDGTLAIPPRPRTDDGEFYD